jgi:transposase-like protein
MALAEMYGQGVSTRKVKAITEQRCGTEISSTHVSRATAQLDEVLEAWRTWSLGEYVYLYLDARYEKVRQDGQVRNVAVLIAAGVNWEGKREILGISVALGEQEVYWRAFLQDLVQRGLQGVRLTISDAHAGLKDARQAVFDGIPWQRCQLHLQRNTQAYVPRKSMLSEVANDLRTIFNAPDRATAEAWLAQTVKKYENKASRLANWMETNIPEGLTVFSFPRHHQRRIRTTNLLERLSREIKRRTCVVGIFPNEAACSRLISAFLMEKSEAWLIGRMYLNFEGSEERGSSSSPS